MTETAEDFGGEEEYPTGEYTQPEPNTHYSDKGDHKERSLFHQPRHEKHWKKVEQDTAMIEP